MKTDFYKFIRHTALVYFVLCGVTSYASASGTTSSSFYMQCPSDVYAHCTDELWNLSIYGNATYVYNYRTYSAGSPVVKYYLNSCNTGYITRTWTVEDYNWQWHSCTQTIYVSSGGSSGVNITWPKDVELEGCNPKTSPSDLPYESQYPTWGYSECGMLGKSYSDMIFTVNSQCKKIMRTWKVLDWCNYNGYGSTGQYSRIQTIYIINGTVPEVNCPAEILFNSYDCKNADVKVGGLVIDPSVCGGNFDVTNNSPYSYSKGNNISGIYPIGTTKVTYTIKYGCGKLKFCTTNVVVKNAALPVPYCIYQLNTALMGIDTDKDGKVDNGMVEIWAKDLNKGSYSACGNDPLVFSFSTDTSETSKTFTCDQIGKSEVKMWVTDSKGAQNFCLVDINVQNNGANIPNCKPKPSGPPIDTVGPTPTSVYAISGNITTLTDTTLEGARITLRVDQPNVTYKITYDTTTSLELDSFINFSGYKLYRYNMVRKITEKRDSTVTYTTKTAISNRNGKYLFDSLAIFDRALTLSAEYSEDNRRFIDNNDVLVLEKFLTGEIKYNTYHQYLASDINEDHKVDTADLNILRQFVAGSINTLPGKYQWYLFDKKFTVADPKDIFGHLSALSVKLDSVRKVQPDINFIAFKKGNISVDPGSYQPIDVTHRSKVEPLVSVGAFPNPFQNELQFKINAARDEIAELKMYNQLGQQIIGQNISLHTGLNDISFPIPNGNAGLIIYQCTIGDQRFTGRVIKIE
ncbi:MAG: T9SS type A sorting domain-containing protein [Saprospiraceae bacterium]